MKKIIIVFLLCLCSRSRAEELLLNQAGYMPRLPKYVYTAVPADSFFVTEAATGTVHFKGSFNIITPADPSTDLAVYRGDFSGFSREGRYKITTKSGAASFEFTISDTIYSELFRKSLRGFYLQRCGTQLFMTHAGEYHHLRCHGTDGFFHSTAGASGFRLAAGGWHDAGDYGKYVVNAGITVWTLLAAYELFPEKFYTDGLNIPESGNGIPDLLDEVRYELDWLFTMQDNSGGVFTKLTKEKFEGFIMPNADTGNRFLYQISSAATANFTAVMAQAARIFKEFDSVYAAKCSAAAAAGWNYLSAHPGIVPQGGFKNPAGTETGEYGDGNDGDERLWAAAELYVTTGNAVYHDYYKQNYNKSGLISSSMNWNSLRTPAHLSYLWGKRNDRVTAVQTEIENSLFAYCDKVLSKINQNGFEVSLIPGEYNWGCNSEVLNRAVLLISAYKQGGAQKYLDAASKQLNYILGANAHNISFVTGIGTNKVMHPHHRPSAADNIAEPVPGLLAGGPNQYLNDPVLANKFNSSTPPALCYIDDQGSWAGNEIAINWNAPLVFVSGFLSGLGSVSGIDDEVKSIPTGFNAEPGYPNPFNSSITIKYSLSESESVSYRVYDSLGTLLLDNNLGLQSPGHNYVHWNGKDGKGNNLPSGVYYFQIEGGRDKSTQKILLLK